MIDPDLMRDREEPRDAFDSPYVLAAFVVIFVCGAVLGWFVCYFSAAAFLPAWPTDHAERERRLFLRPTPTRRLLTWARSERALWHVAAACVIYLLWRMA